MIFFPEVELETGLVGGKSAALSRLVAGGFDVPEFFAISAAELDRIADAGDWAALEAALGPALERLGAGPYAVRSSALSEDGAEASHAGQFESLLNIATDGVAKAVRQVHASGGAEHVVAYRAERGLDGTENPAVLVQRMVPAAAAGVAFSADPVRGRRDRAVISATQGLGDKLVDGSVDGETWEILTGGAVGLTPEGEAVLTEVQAREIAELAARAEAYFGAPQDIEWAIEGGRLYLLQSRPITTELKPAPNADDVLQIFDNSNIVESYPGLVSPLTYSFAQGAYARVYRAFVALLGVREQVIRDHAALFDNMLARIDGRVYYNLGNWYRALALLPGFSLNRGFMETMMGVDEPLPEEVIARLSPPPASRMDKLRDLARLVRVAGGLGWAALRLERTKRDFLARFEAALAEEGDLGQAGLTELAELYRKLESALLDKWDAPLINDFLCMMGFGGSRALMEKWGGEAGLRLHADLLIGQGGIVSAEPARRIAEMGGRAREAGLLERLEAEGLDAARADAALDEMVGAYLEKFGDRCPEELKLESLTLVDDPGPLVQAVLAAGRRGISVQEERDAPDWRGVIANPVKRAVARRLARWAQARVRDRENLRFERTRIFGTARRILLAMGRELAARGEIEEARDVFHLTVEEVLGAIEGGGLGAPLGPIVARRKAEQQASESRADPPERIAVRGAALGAMQALGSAGPVQIEGRDEAARTGTGSSAGQLRAVARVIHDPRSETLAPGEIMVARNTDPGWIALFANAGGIVVERGSLLSHSAIVARELGLPCVVGLKQATQWIEDGEEIEIDGSTGEVRKCR